MDKSVSINEIPNNEYIYLDIPKQAHSKDDTYTFELYYDSYNSKEEFGIWVLENAEKDNYFINDNNYGFEFAAAVNYKNYIFAWYPLALSGVCVVYIILDEEGKDEKDKKRK